MFSFMLSNGSGVGGSGLTPVDMFIILGQSNADGRGLVSALPSALTTFYSTKQNDLYIYYKSASRSGGRVPYSYDDDSNPATVDLLTPYFNSNGEWWNLSAKHDSVTKETSMTIGSVVAPTLDNASDTLHGVELSYGYAWAQANPNRELRILKMAVGSSTIDGTWEIETDANDDDGIWHFFENFIWSQAVADLLLDGKTLGNVTVYWMQGESDAGASASSYQGWLETLITKIKALKAMPSDVKIIIGQLSLDGYVGNGPSLEADWNTVKTAQATVAAADVNAELFITDGTGNYPEDDLSGDNLHWDSSALVEQGYRLYAFSAPTAPQSISDLVIQIASEQATFEFSRAFGARSYKLEYKLASSGTWTTDSTVYVAQADAVDPVTDYVVTGLTNDTLYDFRVVAVNDIGETSSNEIQTTVQIPPEDPLSDINANIVLDVTSVYSSSYDGTSQTWTNIVDGSSEPDFWLGADGTADATDPTFTGTAGNSGAYFLLDDANNERFTAKSGSTLIDNMHRTDTGTAWTMFVDFYYDGLENRYILSTSNIGSTAGVAFLVSTSGDNLRVRLYNASGAQVVQLFQSTESLVADSNNTIAFAYDPSDRSFNYYINGTTGSGTGGAHTNTGANPSALTLGNEPGLSAGLDEGCRMIGFALANAKLSTAQLTAVANEMIARRT